MEMLLQIKFDVFIVFSTAKMCNNYQVSSKEDCKISKVV